MIWLREKGKTESLVGSKVLFRRFSLLLPFIMPTTVTSIIFIEMLFLLWFTYSTAIWLELKSGCLWRDSDAIRRKHVEFEDMRLTGYSALFRASLLMSGQIRLTQLKHISFPVSVCVRAMWLVDQMKRWSSCWSSSHSSGVEHVTVLKCRVFRGGGGRGVCESSKDSINTGVNIILTVGSFYFRCV